MSRWRTFWSNVGAVAYKETAIIRHDKAFLSMVLIQPWIMFLLFGFMLSNKPANVPWAVLDQSHGALSRRLVQELQASGYFAPAEAATDYEGARRRLRDGAVLAVLVVPQSFGRDAERGVPSVQLLLDGSDPLSAARIAAYATQIAASIGTRVEEPTRDPDGPVRKRPGLDLRQRFWFNPTLADRVFFLGALAGMLLTNVCLSGTSLGLVGERENGTYEQMLSLPTRPLEIVIGKLVPFVGICYALLLFTIFAPGILCGIWPQGNWLAIFWATLPFTLASLAIGVLVSTLVTTSAQAVFITVFFIMPSFVLSGVMMPYQMMPNGIRQIGGVFPLRWYQIALRRVIDRGGGFGDIVVPSLAMIAIFVALLTVIRLRMKPRLG